MKDKDAIIQKQTIKMVTQTKELSTKTQKWTCVGTFHSILTLFGTLPAPSGLSIGRGPLEIW